MMDAIAYWLPLAGFGGMCVVYWLHDHNRRRMEALVDEERAMLAAVDTSIAVLAQRNRDFAEALELMNYGAQDEAVELLRNWGEVRIVSS